MKDHSKQQAFDALVMHFYAGCLLSMREISKGLGCSHGKVQRSLERTRTPLRNLSQAAHLHLGTVRIAK